MGRPGETWVGRERRGEDGIDVGRPGETWVGRERRIILEDGSSL